MAITLSERPRISQGDVDVVSVNGTDWLDAGETFSSVSSVVEITTSALAAMTGSVNAGTIVVKQRTVAIGKALQWTVSGQQSGTTYRVRFTAVTSASRTVVRDVLLVCA